MTSYALLPSPKAMAIAIDKPLNGGDQCWAYGYSMGKTVEDATTEAIRKCNSSASRHGVFATTIIYAINNDVVYYMEKK